MPHVQSLAVIRNHAKDLVFVKEAQLWEVFGLMGLQLTPQVSRKNNIEVVGSGRYASEDFVGIVRKNTGAILKNARTV